MVSDDNLGEGQIFRTRIIMSCVGCEKFMNLVFALMTQDFRTGVFNLLSSRANSHLSYNPAGRSHCRLQNHHEHIKHYHRGMGGSPGDVDEVPIK